MNAHTQENKTNIYIQTATLSTHSMHRSHNTETLIHWLKAYLHSHKHTHTHTPTLVYTHTHTCTLIATHVQKQHKCQTHPHLHTRLGNQTRTAISHIPKATNTYTHKLRMRPHPTQCAEIQTHLGTHVLMHTHTHSQNDAHTYTMYILTQHTCIYTSKMYALISCICAPTHT